VTAAPGSGKTRVLTARIVHLLEARGLPSHAVLAVAFTRAAAAEIRRRVVDVVGEDLGGLLQATTIHGFALRLLRRVEGRVVLPGEFQVASEEEASEVLLGLFVGGEKRPEAGRTSLRRVQAALTYLDAHGEGSPEDDKATRDIVATYHARMILRGLATHGMVLREVADLLKAGDPDVVTRVEPIAHVLVDEAHDCTPLEIQVLRALRAEETWVHDPRQGIYGWRGGLGIREASFDGTLVERFDLARSFRFGSVIAARANVLLAGQDGYGLPVQGDPSVEDAVLVAPRSGLRATVDDLRSRFGADGVAVLARTNWEAKAAADELGPDVAALVTRREPQALHAALAIARLSLRGDESAFRVLWRLDGGSVTDLHALLGRAGYSRSVFAQWMRDPLLPKAAMPLLSAAADLPGNLARWRDCMQPCASMEGATDLWRLSEGLEDLPVPEALDALSERAEVDDFRRVRDHGKVAVATVHAAKGLEWDAVVVLTGHRWPPMEPPTNEREREESRVAFVAVTRARRVLVIATEGGSDR
jgi:hypothetical protein